MGIPWEQLYHLEMNMGNRYCEGRAAGSSYLLQGRSLRNLCLQFPSAWFLLGHAGLTRPNALNLGLVKII